MPSRSHEIDYHIHGDDMQFVEITLDPRETVVAEAGAMMFMQPGIEMQTSTGGGIFKGCERMVTGESFFLTNFIYQRGGAGQGGVPSILLLTKSFRSTCVR